MARKLTREGLKHLIRIEARRLTEGGADARYEELVAQLRSTIEELAEGWGEDTARLAVQDLLDEIIGAPGSWAKA